MKKVCFIGFMGAGKTHIANLVGTKLGLKVVDTDNEIIKKTGKKIADIFEEGEETFRLLENDLSLEMCHTDDCVISCGGGFCFNDNFLELKKSCIIIFLNPPFSVIEQRLLLNNDRPLVDNNVKILYDKRKEKYIYLSDFVIEDTDEKNIVRKVCDIYEDCYS